MRTCVVSWAVPHMLTPEKGRIRKHESSLRILRAGILGGMEPKICRKINTSLLNMGRKWMSVPQG